MQQELKNIIQQTLAEMDNIGENELVKTSSKRNWEDMSLDFENEASKLITNIKNKKYNTALNDINSLSTILRTWKNKILSSEKKDDTGKATNDFNRF